MSFCSYVKNRCTQKPRNLLRMLLRKSALSAWDLNAPQGFCVFREFCVRPPHADYAEPRRTLRNFAPLREKIFTQKSQKTTEFAHSFF